MTQLLDAAPTTRLTGFRVRSVVPGRQRWDVPRVRGNPRAARALEAALLRLPGITGAQASPSTGRVLVLHDRALGVAEVGAALRDAVTAAATAPLVVEGSTTTSSPATAASTPGGTSGGSVALRPVSAVLRRPLALVAVVTGVSSAVLRHAWRALLRPLRRTAAGARLSAHPLARVLGRHRSALAAAAALTVACQLAELGLGLFLGWILLVLIKGEYAPLTALGVTSAPSQLLALAAGAAATCGVVVVLSAAAGARWRALGQGVRRDQRARLHRHAQRLEMRHIQRERPTRVAGVLADDVDQLGAFFSGPAGEAVQLATSALILVPSFLVLAPGIAWIAFLPLPFVAVLSLRQRDRSAADYADAGEQAALLRSRISANLEAAATVKSACAEDHEAELVDLLELAGSDAATRTQQHTVRFGEGIRAWTTCSMAGTLLVGGLKVLDGSLPFERFSPLIGLPQQMVMRLTRLGPIVDQYQRTLAAHDRVEHLMSLPTETTGGRALARERVSGAIALDRVSFSYEGRPRVLDRLSLRAAAGKVTGIVGATGSGKTTVAKLLMRFQDADSGRVLLDGRDVRGLRLPDLRACVGFVSQDPFLFDGTIADNIRYGTFSATDEQVREAARTAEAHSFVESLPLGYDTVVGEHGASLSGGQRQRIALARTVLKNPPVVVLDEATSAVDNETEAAIQRALATFARGRTLIVIAHRLSTVRNADHIYVLERGGVVEQGAHEGLVASGGRYASLWELQAGARG
ncbi:ABC transporter ATP-binding protein [Actinosynnema pretiosum subsp. pretiosum]|uniref:Fatty acid ABC transporter ATP-binding/permease protein n=1 Tax=Actinosynnema pretiosum subsp. pretiosum TaxID=103721 RepID=A0A1U9Y7P7_9PSEU|nr:ABC transporter transmembrane region protein [Actinosynnema pretiosum subsp. pretiosum]AXX30569.1 ABC transporter, transmembrane region [Actinosynnema pretiosum subsp. pretiosum]QUF05294.1 ABC transporter ATP-binding protein [Actinosynnema pretiosum subsp. pretiosum]